MINCQCQVIVIFTPRNGKFLGFYTVSPVLKRSTRQTLNSLYSDIAQAYMNVIRGQNDLEIIDIEGERFEKELGMGSGI